jgi:hypothetical protein
MWERAAWIAALGVIAAIVGFVVRTGPSPVPFVAAATASSGRPVVPDPTGTPAPAGGLPPCFVTACTSTLGTTPPTRVRIAAIGVDSDLERLTLNAEHELNPPTTYDHAGWYAGGVIPGDPGPAVIAGHVDSYQGPAVFFKLRTLAPGDLVTVRRGSTWLTFRVTVVEEYPKDQFPTDKVYRPTPDPELRVITCGGDFDRVHRRYYDNIVVYAVLA